jgi:hypothetical protein
MALDHANTQNWGCEREERLGEISSIEATELHRSPVTHLDGHFDRLATHLAVLDDDRRARTRIDAGLISLATVWAGHRDEPGNICRVARLNHRLESIQPINGFPARIGVGFLSRYHKFTQDNGLAGGGGSGGK